MKKCVIIILLIIAAGVGSPFFVGKQLEEKLPAYLQRVAQVGKFDIELTSYNRKLFRSDAVTTLTFHGVNAEKIVLQHTIWHGPLPIGQTSTGQWQFSPAAAVVETTLATATLQQGAIAELLNRLPGFDSFQNLTISSLSGSTTSQFSIPPFNQDFIEEGDNIAFEWGGLNGTSNISADLTRIESETTIAGIKLTDATSERAITGLTTTIRIHEDLSGLLLGNATLDCSAITIGPRGLPPEFSVKGFQLRNAAKLDGVTVNYAIEIAVDEIVHPVMTFAPAGFELLFSRLDAATILAVQNQLQKLQTNVVNLPESNTIRQVSDIYIAALPALLQKKPEISLNYLRAQTTDGEVWAKGKLTLSDESDSLITLDNLSRLVQAEGEAQISGDLLRSLVRQTLKPSMESAWQSGQFGDISKEELNNMIDTGSQQQIGALVQQGMLTDDGKNYRLDFSYRNQQATLNGNTLNWNTLIENTPTD